MIGSSITPSFIDAAIATDGSYAYTVVAVDNAGNRALASAPVTIVFDHTPPPAPSIAQAATPTRSLPNLTWTSGGIDLLSGFDHYVVFRDGVAVGTPDHADLPRCDTRDARAAPVRHPRGRRRRQRVGVVAAAHRHLRHPAPADADRPDRADADERTGAQLDRVERRQHGRLGRRGLPRVSATASSSQPRRRRPTPMRSLSISGSHAYWITAIDAVGNESPASPTRVVAIDLDPPQAPPDLSVPQPDAAPSLSWGAATDVGPGPIAIDHYNVYRDGTLIARSTTTNYVDTRVTTSGQVSYTVRAVDLAGNVGPPSTPVAVTIDMTGPSLQSLTIPRERTVGDAGVVLGRRGRPSGLDRRRARLELRRRRRARQPPSRTSSTRRASTRSRSRRATRSATRRAPPRRRSPSARAPKRLEGVDQGARAAAPEGPARARLARADDA